MAMGDDLVAITVEGRGYGSGGDDADIVLAGAAAEDERETETVSWKIHCCLLNAECRPIVAQRWRDRAVFELSEPAAS